MITKDNYGEEHIRQLQIKVGKTRSLLSVPCMRQVFWKR